MLLVYAYTYLIVAFSHGREKELKEGRKQTWMEGGREKERKRGEAGGERERTHKRGYSFISFYETLSH